MASIRFTWLVWLWSGCLVTSGYCYTRGDLSTAPKIANEHSVQFYLVEASFPYNAPSDIVDTAGAAFDEYVVTHAGLGVWDTTKDTKFTIEFISKDYVGALLPIILADDDPEGFAWNNEGEVVVTSPANDEDWIDSQLISVTSGVAYNQLIEYLNDHLDEFTVFQPVEAIYINSSRLNSTTSRSAEDTYHSTALLNSGYQKVPPQDSFWFVNICLRELADFGASVESFLNIYATSFQYLMNENVDAGVIEWGSTSTSASTSASAATHVEFGYQEGELISEKARRNIEASEHMNIKYSYHARAETVPADVVAWYKNLSLCYANSYVAADAVASATNSGAKVFLSAIKACYGDYAYVYRSETSVYNITPLANISSTYSTPLLTQYVLDLPPGNGKAYEKMQIIDYFVVAAAVLLVVSGVILISRNACRKKRRRRVSMEGEKVATRTVDNLADDNSEHDTYYRGDRSSGRSSIVSWIFGDAGAGGDDRGGSGQNSISSSFSRNSMGRKANKSSKSKKKKLSSGNNINNGLASSSYIPVDRSYHDEVGSPPSSGIFGASVGTMGRNRRQLSKDGVGSRHSSMDFSNDLGKPLADPGSGGHLNYEDESSHNRSYLDRMRRSDDGKYNRAADASLLPNKVPVEVESRGIHGRGIRNSYSNSSNSSATGTTTSQYSPPSVASASPSNSYPAWHVQAPPTTGQPIYPNNNSNHTSSHNNHGDGMGGSSSLVVPAPVTNVPLRSTSPLRSNSYANILVSISDSLQYHPQQRQQQQQQQQQQQAGFSTLPPSNVVRTSAYLEDTGSYGSGVSSGNATNNSQLYASAAILGPVAAINTGGEVPTDINHTSRYSNNNNNNNRNNNLDSGGDSVDNDGTNALGAAV